MKWPHLRMMWCMVCQVALPTGPKRNCHTRRRGPSVWSAPNISVDSITITPMASTTGSHTLSQYANPRLLLDMIVGRLAGDDHVVHVALAQSGPRDAYE